MLNTHNLIVDFGKYNGERWTRVPRNYLEWLVNEKEIIKGMEKNREIAKAELERRGTVLNHKVEITPHAIDKASLRTRAIWHKTAKDENEGIYSWLSRVANEAIETKGNNERVNYLGIKFVFKLGRNYPILKTVMRVKN